MIHEKYAEDKVDYFNDKKSRVKQFFQISKIFGTQEHTRAHKSTQEFVTIELTRLTTITTDLKIEEVLQNAESD